MKVPVRDIAIGAVAGALIGLYMGLKGGPTLALAGGFALGTALLGLTLAPRRNKGD